MTVERQSPDGPAGTPGGNDPQTLSDCNRQEALEGQSDRGARIDTRTIITGAIALSVDQASRLSNLSTATIYRALASGHLKRRKYGHRTLIMFADLEAFLEGLAGER